jgi:hypothetical protein
MKIFVESAPSMTPNPSLKPTRYGRRREGVGRIAIRLPCARPGNSTPAPEGRIRYAILPYLGYAG